MVKSYHGEVFKIPWAGNLAEKLTNDSMPGQPGNTNTSATDAAEASTAANLTAARESVVQEDKPPVAEQQTSEQTTPPPVEPVMPITPPPSTSSQKVEPITPVKSQAEKEDFRTKYYSTGEKTARMIGSAFAIAWSFVMVIFFNFYNEYIAYYHIEGGGGITVWQRDSLITTEFALWLPVITTTLILTIAGHIFLIAYDKYLARRITLMILDILGAVSVISLLTIYPFDFSVIPNYLAVTGVNITVTIVLIVMAVAFIISAIVKFIQTIVHTISGEY